MTTSTDQPTNDTKPAAHPMIAEPGSTRLPRPPLSSESPHYPQNPHNRLTCTDTIRRIAARSPQNPRNPPS